MGERKQLEGSFFFFLQKEIPLRSNVATAPNVIPEPRLGSSSDRFLTRDGGRSLWERFSFTGITVKRC